MIHNVKELNKFKNQHKKSLEAQYKKILVCAGTGCVAGGSLDVYDRLKELAEAKGLPVSVELKNEPHEEVAFKKSGCHGFCEMGPLLRIDPQGWLYVKVKVEDCEEILEKSLIGNEPVERLLFAQGDKVYAAQEDIPFYKKQTRTVLSNCGHMDAEAIEEYIAKGGYQAVAKALFDMKTDEIVQEVLDSGLRGRGGGGFPTGRKLQQVAKQNEVRKFVVCNGDEGDPGAFMDRSIMEGDPHKMIEGMLISGIATGAHEGYIYVRAEYPLAVKRLQQAIAAANKLGLLGSNILGSGFNFSLKINQGAGAFVCGEGSALTASIEGNRGMPRVKPPRTVEHGLFDKPTVLSNVETYTNIPMIILNGSDWFRSMGTEGSPGTKAFALTGNVTNTGLIEVPMGTTLREVIFDIGGGIKNGKKFKAVQIGGPSGGCMTEEHLDLPMDFDSLKKKGAMIGSGGLVVMDEDNCMVEVARFFMNFTQNESCGKCVPCREGTLRMLEILERIVEGKGEIADLEMLEELADMISRTALCGLGKTAPAPVISTMKYFKDEYIAHVSDKKCPAKSCQAMKQYVIVEELCKGCSKCARKCPVDAISGVVKSPYTIDAQKCIKCGACEEACSFNAIVEQF